MKLCISGRKILTFTCSISFSRIFLVTKKNETPDIVIFFLIKLRFQLKISLIANILFYLNSKSNMDGPMPKKAYREQTSFSGQFSGSIFQRYNNIAACMLVCLSVSCSFSLNNFISTAIFHSQRYKLNMRNFRLQQTVTFLADLN